MTRSSLIRSVAVATAVGWLYEGGLFPRWSAAAEEVRQDSTSDDVERALIETILPFDDPHFPAVTSATIAARSDALFGLHTNAVYQQGLVAFNMLELYSSPPAAMLAGEAASQDQIAARVKSDAVEFERWRSTWNEPSQPSFAHLRAEARAAYLDLWLQGRILARRRFHQNVKALVMASAYSMDEFWSAIGYLGPFDAGSSR